MIVIVWILIWLLGVMLGVNCITLGAAYLLLRREVHESWQRATTCVVMARAAGVALILLGVLLIYAVCAPIAELPGHGMFKHIFLM
jgi:hypothetical protein